MGVLKVGPWMGRRRRGLSLRCLLLVALVVPLFLAGCAAPTPTHNAALPAPLRHLSAEQPNSTLRLMVQADVAEDDMAARVARLGGRLVHTLSLLDAYALEMPAGAVPALARMPKVRWVSLDAPVESSGKPGGGSSGNNLPANTYLDTLGVRDVWAMGLRGDGIGVAVIDSGIAQGPDFNNIVHRQAFNDELSTSDNAGHGTHVAGIIAGNGANSDGAYAGIAPNVNLIGLNISNESGMAYESDTVAAMQWVLENKSLYNIRVVNLSINSTVQGSYHESAMNAAAEILWFNGIVVVASAGNAWYDYDALVQSAPANDPFLITVGATMEWGTADRSDDYVAEFSATGTTLDGFTKPEILAPGTDIVSVLASNSDWSKVHGSNVVDGKYFRASGTSMSAPMVAGAAALLLQAEPALTPDQVKYRLLNTTYLVPDYRFGNSKTAPRVPALDIHAAVTTQTTGSANVGLAASQLLWTGDEPVLWESVNWNSVNWNSVNWNSVNWNSVNWNSVNWNSVYFGGQANQSNESTPLAGDGLAPMLFLPTIASGH